MRPPSFDAVNYSLRPSKSIQRQIVFDGVRRLHAHLDLERQAYIGFGSIWFTDFVMAHKILGIDEMVSIESHPIGFKRAEFNVPYSMVRVFHGISTNVLPSLYKDEKIKKRPWLVWFDYDYEFNASVKADVLSLVERAPEDSIILVTVNGNEKKYGTLKERADTLRDLFGAIVPDDLPKRAYEDGNLQETLADFMLAYMNSVAADERRVGGFEPAFRVIYKDTTPMITVGGVLPAKGSLAGVAAALGREDWPCRPTKPIVAPHLTMREAAVLQALLPRAKSITRTMLQELGFDLDEDQIEAFQTYYKQYPAFAQIVS